MNGNTLIIKSIERIPFERPTDRLEFKAGVNLIVGERDAGKTVWLRMLDYLMADTSKPEDAFGKEIAEKYKGLRAVFEFSNKTQIVVERKWSVPGALHKIFVDGDAIDSDTFGDFLLNKLEIPIIHYPKGNPFLDRAWPKLSWRTLFRSIYRQERFWAGFVDQQPEGEIAAALLQFLGIADKEFPQAYGDLVEKRKQLQHLEGERDAHANVLHAITSELLQQKELNVTVTKFSLETARERIELELGTLAKEREKMLNEIREKRALSYDKRFQDLKIQKEQLQKLKDSIIKELSAKARRLPDLKHYASDIEAEMLRLQKAKTAGVVLTGFRVTHCPVCEQLVEDTFMHPDICYVCKQNIPLSEDPNPRVNFEIDQLSEEFTELQQLIEKTEADISSTDMELSRVNASLKSAESDLHPAYRLILEMIPPDLGLVDTQSGRLNEQLDQITRVEKNLSSQNKLSQTIQKLEGDISRLKEEITEAAVEVDYSELSQRIEAGMNSYLNVLNELHSGRWSKPPINVSLSERTFKVTVGGAALSAQLGAASHAIVLFAFHYSLFMLAADSKCNYPGLVIVDFPLTLADGASLKDAENYLVEPFIRLCRSKSMAHTQFIAAGRAFENLGATHQIHLSAAY